MVRSNGMASTAVETSGASGTGNGGGKPRKLGRGLSGLIGEPVVISLPSETSGDMAAESVPLGGGFAAAQRGVNGEVRQGGMVGVGGEGTGLGDRRVMGIRVGDIEPSPFQPRRAMDQQQLEELAHSIRTSGVLQPVLVRRSPNATATEERFELVAGERRWRAATLAGLRVVPAIVAELTDEQAAEWALVENVQRADLTPLERAEAVRLLCDRFGLTHAQAADRLGMERSSVTNMVRLTELEEPIKALLGTGALSAGHGKALLGIPLGSVRVALSQRAVEQEWSVRKTEQEVGLIMNAVEGRIASGERGGGESGEVEVQGGAASPLASADQETRRAALTALQEALSAHLGTKVRITPDRHGGRGSLTLKYYSVDHFGGLMTKIGFRMPV